MAINKDYFGWEYKMSLVLTIILPTAFVLGMITRFKEGKIVAGLLRLLLGWNIVWILDLVYMIKDKKIFRFVDV